MESTPPLHTLYVRINLIAANAYCYLSTRHSLSPELLIRSRLLYDRRNYHLPAHLFNPLDDLHSMFRIPHILCSVMRPSFQSRVSPTYVRLLQARKISFIRDHVVCPVLIDPRWVRLSLPYNSQYFEKAVAQGAGRDGSVKSFGDAPLDLKMSASHIVGGKGHGHNPEQLFAMGYACKSVYVHFQQPVSLNMTLIC